MFDGVRRLCLVLVAGVAPAVCAQPAEAPNGVFVVAKPSLADPNFARTVVLVTQAPDASTVGVIVNRPAEVSLRELLPGIAAAANYRDKVYFGGPVMPEVVVALFRAPSPPPAAAFHVLRGLYLSMHPENVLALLAEPGRQYRLYSGFSGWAPRQLESEFDRDGWYVLPADADAVFRADTTGLWSELVRRAETRPTCGGECSGPHK